MKLADAQRIVAALAAVGIQATVRRSAPFSGGPWVVDVTGGALVDVAGIAHAGGRATYREGRRWPERLAEWIADGPATR